MASCAPAHALPGFKKDLNKRRKAKVPESEFKEGPQGLKYYDVVLGKGAEVREGARAVVHYEARWRGVTFMTSRFVPLLHSRIHAAAVPRHCNGAIQCHHLRAVSETPELVTCMSSVTPTGQCLSVWAMLHTSRPEE